MRQLVKVDLRKIQLSKSRPTIPTTVNSLAESMGATGLINPVILKASVIFDGAIMTDGFKVIAGNHRVSAARALGWTEIEAFLHDGEELQAELTEIDENLQRAELSPAQRAAAISRRKEIWEALHPETDRISVSLGGRGNTQFAGDTQKVTGEDRRRTNEHLSRAEALGPDLHAVVGTSLDKGVELDALKELPAEERKELIQRAQAGEQVSARTEQDNGIAGRMISIVVGDFARMLGKFSPEDLADAIKDKPVNPELWPYIEAFANHYRAKRHRP